MTQDIADTSKNPSSAIERSLVASLFFTYATIVLIFLVIVINATRPQQKYFVDATTGETTEVFPLSEPNVTSSALLNWATLAATSAYTLDFVHYEENLNALKEYFTTTGYDDYMSALKASGSLDKIISDRLIRSAVATNTAVILDESSPRGVYTWTIQVPLLITYQGSSETTTQEQYAVTMLVTRVPTEEAPKGIGIAQITYTNLQGKTY